MSKKKDETGSPSGTHGQRESSYEVGYCRPPKHSQFKPGQSGNRMGRPKAAQNLATIARRRLAQKIPVREGGKVQKVSTLEAAVVRLIERAIKGDHRAMTLFFNLARSAEISEGENEFTFAQILPLLTDEEFKFLQDLVKRYKPQVEGR